MTVSALLSNLEVLWSWLKSCC